MPQYDCSNQKYTRGLIYEHLSKQTSRVKKKIIILLFRCNIFYYKPQTRKSKLGPENLTWSSKPYNTLTSTPKEY